MKKQNKKHQNARSIGEKLKTKSLMFFVSFVSCDQKVEYVEDDRLDIRSKQK